VKTPSRLHLGFLDLEGGLGRIYGGMGVALDHPNTVVEAWPSSKLTIEGGNKTLARYFVERFLKAYSLAGNVAINVRQTIPEHVGLGSGTQLALAIATALAKIFQIKSSTQMLATIIGRGGISGVGTAVFERGGFVVEGGLKTEASWSSTTIKGFQPIIFHAPFPEDWLFVVAIPDVKRGFTDEEERQIFSQLPPMSGEEVGKICRLTLMKLLPSIIERDIKSFGEALTSIQRIVGNYFSKVQGGIYSSRIAEEAIAYVLRLGAYGAGQSSWGPAFYGLAHGEERALKLKSALQSFLNRRGRGEVFIAKANNKGAFVEIVD
jgi:beta-RFAP synthase